MVLQSFLQGNGARSLDPTYSQQSKLFLNNLEQSMPKMVTHGVVEEITLIIYHSDTWWHGSG